MTHDRAITWRSVCIGLAGVVFICALTPYNDYALNNTFFVGNNLPLVAVMLLFGALLINAPVNRFVPRLALTSGDFEKSPAIPHTVPGEFSCGAARSPMGTGEQFTSAVCAISTLASAA